MYIYERCIAKRDSTHHHMSQVSDLTHPAISEKNVNFNNIDSTVTMLHYARANIFPLTAHPGYTTDMWDVLQTQ
jgi:hypothetical protein